MQNENTPAEGKNSAQTESESALRDAACSPWLSMDDAPKDGTVIVGKYGNDVDWIRWAETRRCMLAGIGGGNGYFSEGWEDDENGLIVDDPEAWMSVGNYQENASVEARDQ
jgi:hypothetical protein